MQTRHLTRRARLALVVGILLTAVALPVHGRGQTLSAQEISALVSGKTLQGTNPFRGFEIITCFAPDGTFRRIRDGKQEQHTWSVTSSNELCTTRQRGTTCRIMKKEGDVWSGYKIPHNVMKPPSHEG